MHEMCSKLSVKQPVTLQVADLVSWTSLVLEQNSMQRCKAEELLAVLQCRDREEVVMLSGDAENVVYFL